MKSLLLIILISCPAGQTTIVDSFEARTARGVQELPPGVHMEEQSFKKWINKSMENKRDLGLCLEDLQAAQAKLRACQDVVKDRRSLEDKLDMLHKRLKSRDKSEDARIRKLRKVQDTYEHDLRRQKLRTRVERAKGWILFAVGVLIGTGAF